MKNLLLRTLLIPLVILFYSPYVLSKNISPYPGDFCEKGSPQQLARSKELKLLENADQADRKDMKNFIKNGKEIAHRDSIRRKRVGEIFGEGCFQSADDYLEAALIYQHGYTLDHFYQAFIWSKRAADLGDVKGQWFSALALDRYLITIGKKQLFGTQYFKSASDKCMCMQSVEKSYPDNVRKSYSNRSLEDNYKIMASLNDVSCPRLDCKTSLQPTPKGSVVGFW